MINPVSHEQYEAYFTALAEPLEGELRSKMESIRDDLLELPSEDLKKASLDKVLEVRQILTQSSEKRFLLPLYRSLPKTPNGLNFLTCMATKTDSLFTYTHDYFAFEKCMKWGDYDLAEKFLERIDRVENKDILYEKLINAKFTFDEKTLTFPEEFKKLLDCIVDNRVHDQLLDDIVIPNGSPNVLLENPKILKELSQLYRDNDKHNLVWGMAIKMENEQQSRSCVLS